LVCGAVLLLVGAAFLLVIVTESTAVATVTSIESCAVSGDAGRVCTVQVAWELPSGYWADAEMDGVPVGEIHGRPGHQTLRIMYDGAHPNGASTDDLPLWLALAFAVGGAAFVVWGWIMRRRVRSHAGAPDGSGPTSGAVA
jgi:hypothetical protein